MISTILPWIKAWWTWWTNCSKYFLVIYSEIVHDILQQPYVALRRVTLPIFECNSSGTFLNSWFSIDFMESVLKSSQRLYFSCSNPCSFFVPFFLSPLPFFLFFCIFFFDFLRVKRNRPVKQLSFLRAPLACSGTLSDPGLRPKLFTPNSNFKIESLYPPDTRPEKHQIHNSHHN